MKYAFAALAAITATLGLAAKPALPSFVTTPSGLHFVDMRPGSGKAPELGQTCVVLYRGWIYNDSQRGPLIEAVQDPKKPFRFVLGKAKVAGWNEGLQSMKVGGKRLLIVPPGLGYVGPEAEKDVPPGSTLLFEMELLSVQ